MDLHPLIPDETADLVAAVPPQILESLRAYAVERRPTGNFLCAVLANNLQQAISYADPGNMLALAAIGRYVYNALPSECWGSPGAVAAWLKARPEDAAEGCENDEGMDSE